MLFRICTGLAAATAVLAAGSPALAAGGVSRVVLTYTADAGHPTAVKLTCDPAGGAHPQPARACAALTRTGANPARLKPADKYCFLLYKPITARLTGTWRGRTVKWTHTYGNSCEMNRATGVLFAF